MNIDDIEKTAKLSRINIDKDEQEELLRDMKSILDYVDDIQKVITEERLPKAGMYRNVMREDEKSHKSGEYTDDILSEAPYTKEGYIKVKKIL